MDDPALDRPPADHGSDRQDYVEVQAPPGIRPLGAWWDELVDVPCPTCRANLFAEFTGTGPDDAWQRSAWTIRVAHDDDCPVLFRCGVDTAYRAAQ